MKKSATWLYFPKTKSVSGGSEHCSDALTNITNRHKLPGKKGAQREF